MNNPSPRHISVTVDFLRSLPELDIDSSQDHLRAALYAVGFDINNEFETKFGASLLRGVNVRCRNRPYLYRKTDVFVGTMRKEGFLYDTMYCSDSILDIYDPVPLEFCSDLPFDLPIIEKANTRKYTKKKDKIDIDDILAESFSLDDSIAQQFYGTSAGAE